MKSVPSKKKQFKNKDIAIVGISCRFPGAKNYHEFWYNLSHGIQSIKEIDRWNFKERYYGSEDDNQSPCKWMGHLDDMDKFDNEFFHISPREAKHMDPQQRILLEESWHCIEDSGVSVGKLQKKKTGVYVAASDTDPYFYLSQPQELDIYSGTGNYQYMLSNRISYFFGLHGISKTIDTACSSSLVALHDARTALAIGETDYALVSGVNMHFSPLKHLIWSKNRMLSRVGKCQTFDMEADGFVPGEGVAVLLLQPLEQAVADRNHVYGVIKGSAVNHGGRANSISSPRVEAQEDVILSAYKDAGISAETVSYIEAHGTGTSLGDPIEVEALTRAFQNFTSEKQFCKIGSVKTNIGHLVAAAGMPGVIKVLLMMQNNTIVPTLNIKKINPIIDFENSPFTVASKREDWISTNKDIPLRAGVSSFGYGGVSSHALIEKYEPAESEPGQCQNAPCPFLISAGTPQSLGKMIGKMKDFVSRDGISSGNFRDACMTLLTGRQNFAYRFGGLAKDKADLFKMLENASDHGDCVSGRQLYSLRIRENLRGSYSEWQRLCTEFPIFKEKSDQLFKAVRKFDGNHQIAEGFSLTPWPAEYQPLYTFIITYSVISALADTGLKLNTVTGIQDGFWTALTVSRMISLNDLFMILLGKKEPGQLKPVRPAMTVCDPVHSQEIKPYNVDGSYLEELVSNLVIPDDILSYYIQKAKILYANQYTFKKYVNEWKRYLVPVGLTVEHLLDDNGPLSPKEKNDSARLLFMVIILSSLLRVNKKWNLSAKKVLNNERFYELLDLVVDEILPKDVLISLLSDKQPEYDEAARIVNERINRPFISKTGEYAYLRQHCKKVNEITDFSSWAEAMSSLSELPEIHEGFVVDLENPDAGCESNVAAAIHFGDDLTGNIQKALIDLWHKGADLNWSILYPEGSFTKIPMPGYCFAQNSFWITGDYAAAGSGETGSPRSLPATVTNPQVQAVPDKQPVSDGQSKREIHFLSKQWETGLYPAKRTETGTVVILATEETEGLANRLARHFAKCRILDYRYIASDISNSDNLWKSYGGLIDLAGCGTKEYESSDWIKWVQRLSEFGNREGITLLCVTRELEPYRNNRINLAGASHVSLFRMLQSEYSFIRSRHMDSEAGADDREFAEQIANEYLAKSEEPEVCYRDGSRYQAVLKDTQKRQNDVPKLMFAEDEVLLVTGGTRGLGCLCAKHFIQEHGVRRVALTGRQKIPPREMWPAQTEKSMIQKINLIKELEAQGIKVMALSMALTDERSVNEGIKLIKDTLGPIGGAIHCAGILDTDNPAFIRKPIESIERILNPKTKGLRQLYHALSEEPLRFFVLFSSVSAIIPTLGAGQSDYSMANGYMDYFAWAHHSSRPIISVEWPSWKETGMGEIKNRAYQQTGLLSHTNAEGLALLDHILSQRTVPGYPAVILPAVVNPEKWRPELLMKRTITDGDTGKPGMKNTNVQRTAGSSVPVLSAVRKWLIHLFAEELNLEPAKLEINTQFQNFGIDSIFLAQIVKRMEKEVESIAVEPSSLLEYPTIKELSEYLVNTYPGPLNTLFAGHSEDTENHSAQNGSAKERIQNTAGRMNEVKNWLIRLFSEELDLEQEKLDGDKQFQEFGIDSIFLAQIVKRIDKEIHNLNIEPSSLLEYPSINTLADFMIRTYPEALSSLFTWEIQDSAPDVQDAVNQSPEITESGTVTGGQPTGESTRSRLYAAAPVYRKEKIAVVGMACHFPDAPDIQAYWNNLVEGKSSVREIPKSRWDWRKNYCEDYQEDKIISKWGGFLNNIENFDPDYFKISKTLAPKIDPLQRQWMEVSVEALADAGFAKETLWGKPVGVFAGTRTGAYVRKLGRYQKDTIVGTAQNFVSVHLAHFLNFKGPNMVIDAACASSLTAVHMAIRSIQSGDCEVALAGGVTVLEEADYKLLSAAKILSPDGLCKAFDASANGIGVGEGCGVLVLKPLPRAIADNDKIYAVIDGSAVNSDGTTMGVTTPNPEAQRELVKKAIADGEVDPATITYMEAHGTGTLIGDPIELRGLTRVFEESVSKKQFCGVGSVKSNLGHLLSASGVASVIKVILSIIHQQIPPTIHCDHPNPRFNFEKSPLYLVRKLMGWKTENNVLRAGISSYGLGGNNAHIIVSNEGIPDANRASAIPRGTPVVFNRQRYWPGEAEENPQTVAAEHTLNQEDAPLSSAEKEFMDFFETDVVE